MSTDPVDPRAPPPLNILVAYPYATRVNFEILRALERIGGARWFLDSGAFTAWKSGKPIQLDDYCRFLSDLPIRPWRYITLDVIGDGEASLRNYRTMLSRGLQPVPVFTRGEDFGMLATYYETSDLVCIGGLVSRISTPKPYLKALKSRLVGRDYHILGFSSLDWIKYLRPYSVDSTSWDRASRYGILNVYMGRGRLLSLTRDELPKILGDAETCARIRQLGYDAFELRPRDAWRGGASLSRAISAAAWCWLSLDMEKQLGTRLFLASVGAVAELPDAYRRALVASGYVPNDQQTRGTT